MLCQLFNNLNRPRIVYSPINYSAVIKMYQYVKEDKIASEMNNLNKSYVLLHLYLSAIHIKTTNFKVIIACFRDLT